MVKRRGLVIVMEELVQSVTIYTVGQREFTNRAEAYEHALTLMTAYRIYDVHCQPDLQAGAGYRLRVAVLVHQVSLQNLLLHFLVSKFGNPVAFVRDAEPIDNWQILADHVFTDPLHLQAYLRQPVPQGLGAQQRLQARPLFLVDDWGEELLDSPLLTTVV